MAAEAAANETETNISDVFAGVHAYVSRTLPDGLRKKIKQLLAARNVDLVHFDNVTYKYPKAVKPVVSDVTFTVQQGGRCAFIGAVRVFYPLEIFEI